MIKLLSGVSLASILLITLGYSTVTPNIKQSPPQVPKRVILLIAEGMGLQQITAGLYSNNNKLRLEEFPVIGFHKNSSADHLTAETAAALTAIACGVKIPDGRIAVDGKGEPAKTILEQVQEKSFATGIITNTSLTAPAPAAFYAHVDDENMHEDIAMYLSQRNIDFLVGGGKKYFENRKSDQRNLYDELKQQGYQISNYSEQEFGKGSFSLENNYCFFTAEEYPQDKDKAWTDLFNASKLALNFLKEHNNKGNFFLLIEDSEIQIQSHENNTEMVVKEILHLDELMGMLIDFAKKDKETLIVVTGDHETGGFAVNPGSTQDSLLGVFMTRKFTGTMMPVFAFGPGSEYFSGIYDNVDIYERLKKAINLN